MSKHTLGPWQSGWGDGVTGPRAAPSVCFSPDTRVEIPIRKEDQAVAWVLSVKKDGREDADARLIAAAPELLEALEYARDLLRSLNQEKGGTWDHINRAIAKATGE